MTPDLFRAADDVPDLLNGGMGDCFRDLAGLKLEVSNVAETAEMAQRPAEQDGAQVTGAKAPVTVVWHL
jgi:hypothetical protein